MPAVILYSPEHSGWVRYERPHAVFRVCSHAEIMPLLGFLEDEVERTGLHAAGFLSYEAGHAFDPAIPRGCGAPFPLAWFGLFEPPLPVCVESTGGFTDLDWKPEIDGVAHARALHCIREHLAQGETYQVNYTYRMRAPFAGNPWDVFCALTARQPSPHGAYVDIGDFAVCCASPEMFFWRDGEDIWSRPMKGTMGRGRWVAEDEQKRQNLAESEKDRAENVMIVDMVRNDLGRVCLPGTVHVPELFATERYPTVWQMTSLIRGRTRVSTAGVMSALFPAASITGAPKIRTMELIRDLEISPRGIYTGTIGVMAPGRKARFNVAIRTVLVDRDRGQAEYGVGGGIVWDSLPEAEYQETLIKAGVLKSTVPAFSLVETMRWRRVEGIAFLDTHLQRVLASAEYFGIELDLCGLRLALHDAVRDACGSEGVIRLLVDSSGTWSLAHRPLPPGGACRVALAVHSVDSGDPFLFHKTTRREVYEKARAGALDVDDVVLWNERGEVTEATIANLVVDLDGVLVTPPLESGLLPGVLRATLLREGKIHEQVIMREALRRCSRFWLVSAVRGWREAELVGSD